MAGFDPKSPGVYLQTVDEGLARGLTTGVPAFLGVVASPPGPSAASFRLDEDAFADLDLRTSGAWAPGHLRAAVRGFFENGGESCHVVPLASAASLEAALGVLSTIEDFDLVVAPDLVTLPNMQNQEELEAPAGPLVTLVTAQARLLKYCANRGTCFALLDTPRHVAIDDYEWQDQADLYRDRLESAIVAVAAEPPERPAEELRIHGAVYTPWCEVPGSDDPRPIAGHVAGVLARVDRDIGAHKAPANEVVEGLVDVEVRLDAALQEALNPPGETPLNCLRPFAGRGIRVWGARTLSADRAFAHVSARRTVLSLRRRIELTMPGMTFEPNDLRLWIRIQRELGGVMSELFERGALKGASPEEAFYVKCDDETNPPAVRDAGQVVTEIGLALAVPSEFLVVRITHEAAGGAANAIPVTP